MPLTGHDGIDRQDGGALRSRKTTNISTEYDLSMKCLNDYGHDKNQCELYFQNYRYCRKFWSVIKSERKKEGIEPVLPPPEEREDVKKKYLPHLKDV
ncbi:unnamed protein product [Candidula unifasciata]|uniref:Coiled-coil-helix-coiled-coil-helix domain-containing protein 7 n=1 Tax=Candidula unifasciata TaxID=100452 RepID=A0A8S3YWZ1_9EUPU|nr:unnamed protein product [Candidula unifasciata]